MLLGIQKKKAATGEFQKQDIVRAEQKDYRKQNSQLCLREIFLEMIFSFLFTYTQFYLHLILKIKLSGEECQGEILYLSENYYVCVFIKITRLFRVTITIYIDRLFTYLNTQKYF